MKFVVQKTKSKDYDAVLLLLSTESVIEQIKVIEDDSNIKESSGTLLIDQLFLTGNNENRFISCSFTNGKLDLETIHVTQPDSFIQKEIAEWLYNHYEYVENSILTKSQKEKIKLLG